MRLESGEEDPRCEDCGELLKPATVMFGQSMPEGEMLRAFGCERGDRPYNQLITRDWMLFAPRSREKWESTSVNALGFAGALLVRDEGELARVRGVGPMQLLRHVAVARD